MAGNELGPKTPSYPRTPSTGMEKYSFLKRICPFRLNLFGGVSASCLFKPASMSNVNKTTPYTAVATTASWLNHPCNNRPEQGLWNSPILWSVMTALSSGRSIHGSNAPLVTEFALVSRTVLCSTYCRYIYILKRGYGVEFAVNACQWLQFDCTS